MQDPNSTNKIAADRDHISLTNQTGEYGGINSINSVQLGLLRGAKRMVATVIDTTTGEIIFQKEQVDISKSYNYGGAIYGSSFDVDFSAADYDLKNNTKYIFRLTGYIDYKNGEVANNTFEFPFYADFSAPIVTGVEYTYEYDRDSETNKLYANISVYDNHYVRGMMPGYITESEPGADAPYSLYGFGRYIVPVNGARNSTSVVQVELTDYLRTIKEKSYNKNSFIVQLIDCAQNISTFELTIPDDIKTISFADKEITISPNQIYNLNPELSPSQDKAWKESINYTLDNDDIARVVNGKLIGVSSGTTKLTATSNRNPQVTTSVTVHVLKDGEPGYKEYDRPVAENFRLTGYEVNRVYYFLSSDERDLGATEAGDVVQFASDNYSLKMLPSESVTIQYDLQGYFEDSNYRVEFTSSNPEVIRVDKEKGTITAWNVDKNDKPLNYERNATVSVRLLMLDPVTKEYKSTTTTRTIYITVKPAYTTNGPYLVSYMGLGDKVEIPEDLGITEIQQFAFSNWNLVPKDLSAGDEISKEDPLYSKQWYIGNDIITELVIPEGVKTIGAYAFANLSKLRKVTFPSTLTKIQTGAFRDCVSLASIEFHGSNNLQFINQRAFENCTKLASFDFRSIVAIGDAAFRNTLLISVNLPNTTQSIGAAAFAQNASLTTVNIAASKVKVGSQAFAATSVKAMTLNASVLPAEIFADCDELSHLSLGADVEVIGENALIGTKISKLEVSANNPYFSASQSGKYLLKKGTGVLALVAPTTNSFTTSDLESGTTITEIGAGAFSVAAGLTTVNLPTVTRVGDYAFADCASLSSVQLGKLESVGSYAFVGTAITTLPQLSDNVTIGERAFSMSSLTSVTLPTGAEVGDYAFAQLAFRRITTGANGQQQVSVNYTLKSAEVGEGVKLGAGAFFFNPMMTSATIGDNVVIGEAAFSAARISSLMGGLIASNNYYVYNGQSIQTGIDPFVSGLTSLTIGNNAEIGDYAFQGAGSGAYSISSTLTLGGKLETVHVGENATVGAYAFNSCHYLKDIDFSHLKSIGAYAFSGEQPEYILFASGEILIPRVNAFGAAFEEADLSALDFEKGGAIGEGAFYNCTSLQSVDLPETAESIPAGAFMNCTSLATIDLQHVKAVGAQAFANTALTEVTVADGAQFGANAFSGNKGLSVLNGKAALFGDSAFANTTLGSVDLSEAQYLGNFAFADTKLRAVEIGEALVYAGENPFAGCEIGDITNAAGETTFTLGDAIKVVDGVLYCSCPNGYVLVTYPIAKEESSFNVAEGTVRIGAQAFRGAHLYSVSLSRRVKSIGDAAFYGCNELAAVAFTSIEAPILEEQYDADFDLMSDSNGRPYYLLHNVGYYVMDENTRYGLQVVDFRLWNIDPTNTLFGANFVAEIGTPEGREILKNKTLVMVRPINGTGYDSFIYGQYFDVVLDGPTAVSDAAQEVIDLINALPATSALTLDDRAQVEHIRTLFNALPEDQQGCVYNENLSKLTDAENRISYLEEQEKNNDPEPSEEEGIPYLWLYIVLSVVAVAAIVAVVLVVLLKKRKRAAAEEAEESADGAEANGEDGGFEEADGEESALEPSEEENQEQNGQKTED